jgi:hypothetical protein
MAVRMRATASSAIIPVAIGKCWVAAEAGRRQRLPPTRMAILADTVEDRRYQETPLADASRFLKTLSLVGRLFDALTEANSLVAALIAQIVLIYIYLVEPDDKHAHGISELRFQVPLASRWTASVCRWRNRGGGRQGGRERARRRNRWNGTAADSYGPKYSNGVMGHGWP